ncbi:TANK-binding kinase 1-binding protein 1 isoform X3 [Hemicordylus capensis]|uniref:TANK-binding kinase 1-binding protein 1 isoform X3 n=1 Tax=Hemicordylus capensis TaxID=884348 RepID=UPI0023029436|nr:TANK-binding kinase 1-binding protein 1 isoform X3 [Hemicordylus capensis]
MWLVGVCHVLAFPPKCPPGPDCAMDSMFEDDISILTQDALVQDDEWLDSPNTDLSSEMCSASHFALITAYDDIKNRLTGLERENASLKRKLKMYEIKFPLISEFGEERIFPSYDSKETSLLKTEKANLQQQLNQFQRERALVETHLNRIRSLEQQLRQRDGNSFQNLNSQLQNQEVQYLSLHGNHVLDRSMNWQSPRSLEQAEGLEVQRLEVELEETRQEVQNSQHREEQLKAECERLQAEVKQLQETRAQDLATSQSERDMAWVKKVGDDQVNLALAYTELTEELCRLRNLSSLQSQILRTLMQEQAINGGQRHSPHSQRHSPAQQRRSPAPQCSSPAQQGRSSMPQCQSPALQRRSPAPPCQSPAHQRRSPAPPPCQSPASQRRSPAPPPSQPPAQQRCSPAPNCSSPAITSQHRSPGGERSIIDLGYSKPSSHHIKASFQGRRSYSEVSDAAVYQQNRSLWLQPEASTLPKHRPYSEVYARDAFEEHLHFEKQSSDEDDWALPSPPSPEAGGIRCASFCAGFPIPDTSTHRTDASYSRAEHAQSWPSINLLMETVDSDIRSCPLCQVAFPIGYPDDALIKHIDSHLENSKI